ncbi:unnamed protein product [marine sediment metagenome]|uniref:Adenylate kinase active site lid domain-containing protein n=1 Tax=marine sediment metagenome TaxID=412755 RepID=X0UWP8_9ZZZZ
MNLIFFGPPGVGKGTIAKMLSKHFKLPHISSGNLIREEVKLKTKSGIEVEPYVNKGLLIPDAIVIDLIKDRIKEKDCKNGIILDGFPRTIFQAENLSKSDIEIHKVIDFTASEKTLIMRISGRRMCSKCNAIYHIKNIPPKQEGICDKCGGKLYQREDDKPEAIKKRLIVYEKETKPLIEYYKKKNLIADVDTEKPLPEIFKDTLAAIG